MKLLRLSESDKAEYNNFVAAQTSGTFLQSWDWGEWLAQQGHEVFRFKITDDGNTQIGAVQFIKMPLPGGRHYIYAPYGPVTDLRFKIEDLRFLLQELQTKYPGAMFARIEPLDKSVIHNPQSVIRKSTNIQPAITMVVDINRPDEELLAGMHSKTRYNIKVAQKHGVSVGAVSDQNTIKEAIALIVKTQARQHYRGHSARYYQRLLDFFGTNNGGLAAKVYVAQLGSELLATGIMIDFGFTRTYLYGGSSENYRNVMAPYLLHWQAMRDGRGLGMKNYDLGGAETSSGGERGFTRFKQGFGGRVAVYAGAYDAVFKPLWYTMYAGVRRINRFLRHVNT